MAESATTEWLATQDGEAARWNEERQTFLVKETATHIIEIRQFSYTWAILLTPRHFTSIYDDRWCYASFVAAYLAADAWDPETEVEPVGWHRHPKTGRRRTRGDATQEYVNW